MPHLALVLPALVLDHRALVSDQRAVVLDRPELVLDQRALVLDQPELVQALELGLLALPILPMASQA